MSPRLPALLLLAVLTACGGGTSPVAAPSPSPSPTPSPTPAAPLFTAAEAQGALLAVADAPAGYAAPRPEDGFVPPPRGSLSLCPGTAVPPGVPTAPVVLYQGPAGFDSVTELVAVLPTEAVAVAVVAAVGRHAATCPRTATKDFSFTGRSASQRTTRSAVVPLRVGAWSGVRQSSSDVYTSRKDQRWTTQHVVLRRSNAVLDLEVAGETAPPDLQGVLTKALAKLDAVA